MKIKELPISLYQSLRLRAIPVHRLNTPRDILPVVVSLTSIPERLDSVDISIRSVMSQAVTPKKIVLWLHESLKNAIPGRLQKLTGDLFSIEFVDWDSSHLKLVCALKKYPDDLIVTMDDDLIYQKGWLPLLYESHLKHPSYVIANQSRLIRYGPKGDLLPYDTWPTNYNPEIGGPLLLPIGSAGALYPPGSLDIRFSDTSLFKKLAPKADDLWFKAMSLLNDTPSMLASKRPGKPVPILGSQKLSLKKGNIEGDQNRVQWLALTNYFKLTLNGNEGNHRELY